MWTQVRFVYVMLFLESLKSFMKSFMDDSYSCTLVHVITHSCSGSIAVQYAYKKDGSKGERHGRCLFPALAWTALICCSIPIFHMDS